MPHLDEGTLHALLDGELKGSEVAAINAHLGGCSACTLRLKEAKEFRAEADRLIESVDLAELPVARAPLAAAQASPPVAEPVRAEPVRTEPPRAEPPRAEPPRAEPPRAEPPRAEPPRREPPRREPPRLEVHPPEPKAPEPERAAPPPRERPAGRREPAHPEATRPDLWNEGPPPLLIPDNEGKAERRQRVMRRLSFAASIAVLVGTAALAYKLRPGAAPFPVADSVASQPDQVVSPLERTGAADARGAGRGDTIARVPAPSLPRDEASANAPAADRPISAARDLAGAQKAARPLRQAAPAAPGAPTARAATRTAAPPDTTRDTLPETTAAEDSAVDTANDQNLAEVKRRAADALAQLDRERRRDQAAAATAALDSTRRRALRTAPSAAPAPVTAPPPAPLTPEQRAGIYLRVGLDEASRQLGGPVHVIEGMSALFMGLAAGRADSGADSTRPLVRVVYQDSQGRLVLLDQQRLRSGQPPPQGPLAWATGETGLWLRGEPPADVLRTLRPRVR